MNKFVIVAEARCGYQFLATLLNSNPKILCLGEIFGKKKVRIESLFGKPLPIAMEEMSAINYVQKHLLPFAYQENKMAIGFKLNHNDCQENQNWRPIWNWLVEENWKIIHLQRTNCLDRAMSEKLAMKEWNWHHKPYGTQVRITLDELDYYYNRSMKRKAWTENQFKNNPMLNLTYEELNADKNSICNKVQSFLEVPLMNLTSSFKKQRSGGQSKYLMNYRHLYHHCIKHPTYKKWLTDIPML